MDLPRFRKTLVADAPPPELTDLGRALWYAGRGDWDRAHDIVEVDPSAAGAAVHAYLHRVEGDDWNADYWYRRAGRQRPGGTVEEEWEGLVGEFVKAPGGRP